MATYNFGSLHSLMLPSNSEFGVNPVYNLPMPGDSLHNYTSNPGKGWVNNGNGNWQYGVAGPSVPTPTPTPASQPQPQNQPAPTNTPAPTYSGGSTTGGVSTGGSSTPSQSSLSDSIAAQQNKDKSLATDQFNTEEQNINNYFDSLAGTYNNNLTTQGTQRDNTLSQIDSEYQNLINGVNQTATDNINSLKSQQEKLDSQYAKGKTNVANAFRDAQLVNRNTARGMNALDSSYYEGLQGKSAEDAATQDANLVTEQGQNDAQIGNQIGSVQLKQSNDVNDLNNKRADARAQAYLTYQNNVGQIQNDLTMNDKQRKSALMAAQNQLSQDLDQIDQNYLNWTISTAINPANYGSSLLGALASYVAPNYGTPSSMNALPALTFSSSALNSAGSPLYATPVTQTGGGTNTVPTGNNGNNQNSLINYIPTIQ